jgi:hypothetical protein
LQPKIRIDRIMHVLMNTRRRAIALLATAAIFSPSLVVAQPAAPEAVTPGPIGKIERLDPAIDALVPRDAKIEVLADGFDWSEGPVWLPNEQCLVFFRRAN